MDTLNGVSTVLVTSLQNAGYEVLAAGDQTAPLSLGALYPTLIVLNLQMPQGNGQRLRYELRGQADVPLLVLTASAHEDDHRHSAGRVRTIMHQDSNQEQLIFGPMLLDCEARVVTVNNQPILLTPREFALLEMFVRNPGRTFSRSELLALCWGTGYNGVERVVDVHVVSLRRKLGKEHLIMTVRGVGYRLREVQENKRISAGD